MRSVDATFSARVAAGAGAEMNALKLTGTQSCVKVSAESSWGESHLFELSYRHWV
jgi:hypothetical protein